MINSRHELQNCAKRFGFIDAGIMTDFSPSEHASWFDEASHNGWFGDMDYLKRTRAQRVEPLTYLPWARSALVVLYAYGKKTEPHASESPRIAEYAQLSADYHDLLSEQLTLCAHEVFPKEARTHVCVDTAPVNDRLLAQRAGLGFIGKNGLLISPRFGSKVLIAIAFSDSALELTHETSTLQRTIEAKKPLCGSCTQCLDTCPTQAFEAPYRLNATKCISYWTIETKEKVIPSSIARSQKPWVFGCDVCQNVCPWNRFTPDEHVPRSSLRSELTWEHVQETVVSQSKYSELRKNSPLERLAHWKWQRNVHSLTHNQPQSLDP